MLSWSEIESRAIAFAARWRDCPGDEKQYGQLFERDFVSLFGVGELEGFHEFKVFLADGSPAWIDYLLPGKLLIEMKSRGKSLASAYSQAMGYVRALKPEEVPQLVMVSDFDQVRVYNLKKDHPYKPFRVRQLKNHTRIFGFLAGYGAETSEKTEIEVNTEASYKMARIHDALKENGYAGHALEVFLVRLLFCLFADDTGIFEKDSFQRYIAASSLDGSDLSMRLNELFWVLNTPIAGRMKTLSEELQRFRYINGTIFEMPLPPASFDAKLRTALVDVSREFDWTLISPSIFGAMFQGVMDPKARRALGAHYTSTENILKVIQPLFLDDLYSEFERSKATTRELRAFQDKLASLTFMDPACGSGNFLIVTYQELRRLEFEVLKLLYEGSQVAWVDTIIKVKPGQFYGIELEDFPCQVAQLSILLMKHLMDAEVGEYFGINIIDFPIRENANIVRGNALQLDWNKLIPAADLDYIIGNPPFIGARVMLPEQKTDLLHVFGNTKNAGNLDFVASWFKKTADFMQQNPRLRTALVSTNSISQGDQVAILWAPLLKQGIKIDFAWRTFKWSNEAKGKAAVHCVVIGFSLGGLAAQKVIYHEEQAIPASNINPYLVDAPDVLVESRSKPLCDVPEIGIGNQPIDGGHYLFTLDDMKNFLKNEPEAEVFFRQWYGSQEFINKMPRYCLYLANVSPSELRNMPLVLERVNAVRAFRHKSKRTSTKRIADDPTRFQTTNTPNHTYLLIPKVSSEKRKYVPIGFMDKFSLASDLVFIVSIADLFHFGILTSNVHMAWLRTVAGRLKSDFRYSKDIVYNNFIWPDCTPEQKERIDQTAQGILDARARYPDDTYADLYDDTVMPVDLRRAHQDNDRAVWEAYGKAWPISDENACVAYLMKLYQQKTGS